MGCTTSSDAMHDDMEAKQLDPDTKARLLSEMSEDMLCPDIIKVKAWTILHWAVFAGREDMIERILSVAPEMINQQSSDGMSALDVAFKQRQEQEALRLLELCPSQIDAVPSNERYKHFSVLQRAAKTGMDTVVAHILAVKPQTINTPIGDMTPLHCAAEKPGNLAVVKRLLANRRTRRALINTVDRMDMTVLHYAAAVGEVAVAKRLLAASPTLIRAVNCVGATVLHIAAGIGRHAMAEYFLARCPELIHAVGDDGQTVLHFAADGGKTAMVEHLLSVSPALIDAVDNEGQTPLHLAAREMSFFSKLPVARALLAVKPELLFAKDSKGSTVLHVAAEHCKRSKELIEELWRLHPEALRAKDDDGRTPFHVAVERGNDVAIELFQWHLTWEEIESAWVTHKEKCSRKVMFRFFFVMETQCESLSLWLLPEVVSTVFEYLGFKRAKKMAAPVHSLMPSESRES